VVERAPTRLLFRNTRMPYTEALLAAIPRLDAAPHSRLPTIPGRPPDPSRRLVGCAFAPRCRYADARCRAEPPTLGTADESGQQYACWRPLQPIPVESTRNLSAVMPGLVPAIHALRATSKGVDGPDEPGHDTQSDLT
jgi:oligopeptide/dipeptide ABC transporter ATP-binding protein